MRWRSLLTAVIAVTLSTAFAAAENKPRGLDIYFVDTDGGAATLIVTPLGESVLIDCGNPGARDADRIYKTATEQTGLKAIDHLIITHWHTDHFGGVGRLAQLMPIRNYYDRGIPESLSEDTTQFPVLIQAYKKATRGKSKTLKPGDELPLKQTAEGPAVRLSCLCAREETIPDKKDAPENPIAEEHKPQPKDTSDNAKSLGFLLSYGGFKFLDLGDLTWNVEYKLVHPTDKIGPIDVYQTTHHGLDLSNNPVLIKTVRPRVAVFNNGPFKGCMPKVTATLRRIPDVKAIYQIHRNVKDEAANTDPAFIANKDKAGGEGIKIAVAPDGKTYTVIVGTKGKGRRYDTRAK